MNFTEEERLRYKRHFLLNEVGEEGQKRLKNGKVLVIGAGGLGSPILIYLAAVGVGTIGIVDFDKVDRSNLQRQVIHTTGDIDIPKVESAKDKMIALNPNVNVVTYQVHFDESNAETLVQDYDFIIDATDNFASKDLINTTCVKMGKPYSFGAINEFYGQTFTYLPGCADYRSFFPEIPDVSIAHGLVGTIPGIIGNIQATEAIKFLCGCGELLTNRLLYINALTMEFQVLSI